ncbi:MAG: phosphoenolpyruvate carboxylase, partial [Patescibacteria group bacterium]|nr:phosphoenolpyruvate carboxylase [Patescibacteria group bacterium]
LNSGMIATVLAIKIALSRYKTLEAELEIPMYPIIGAAALPFRGGISPLTVEHFANEYKGIKTTTIQSAFRYDFEKKQVTDAITLLEKLFAKNTTVSIAPHIQKELQEIIALSESFYRKTVEQIAPLVNSMALHMPKRRERVQHIGLFGYSRGIGKVTLPRAITFTASLYSLGIPPEFIGTGRTLKELARQGKAELLETYYLNLKSDLQHAGAFVNKDILAKLMKSSPVWKDVATDIAETETYLGITFGPRTSEEKEHQKQTNTIFTHLHQGHAVKEYIEKAAILRQSLG